MAITFAFFSDSGLTTPVGQIAFTQQSGGSAPADQVVYFGSATAGRIAKAASNPGVDQVSVSIADSAPGTGHAAAEVRLSADGVTFGSAGAALNLGTQVAGGAANAKPVYVRWADATGTVGSSTELSLTTNTLNEY
jgi:hypothetical protein